MCTRREIHHSSLLPCAIVLWCDSVITLHFLTLVLLCQPPFLKFNPTALFLFLSSFKSSALLLSLLILNSFCTLHGVSPLLSTKLNCGKSNGGKKKLLIIACKILSVSSVIHIFLPLLSTISFYSFHPSLSVIPSFDLLFSSVNLPTASTCSVSSSLPSLPSTSFHSSPELQHVSGGSCSDSISQINDCEEIKRREKQNDCAGGEGPLVPRR